MKAALRKTLDGTSYGRAGAQPLACAGGHTWRSMMEERMGDGANSVAYSQEALRGARKGPKQLLCRVREA